MKNNRKSRNRHEEMPSDIGITRILAGVFGVTTIVLLVLLVTGDDREKTSSIMPAARQMDRPMDVKVLEVASKFFCGCGTCDEHDLVSCTCPTALEIKSLIDRELKIGKMTMEVVKQINIQYTGIKPQYASLVEDSKSKETSPAKPGPLKVP